MALITRAQLSILIQRIENEPRRFIQVVYGPRQVGKTTAILQLADRVNTPSHYASADAMGPSFAVWIDQQWDAARVKAGTAGTGTCLLILDEIQKIDNWSEQVKQQWDRDTREGRDIKVILLGSSRLLLQRGLTESLAGRFETMYMPHWSLDEMRSAFDMTLDEYIWFGGYPGAAALRHDERRWREYVFTSLIETSISRDLLMLTRIDKPALLRRLFEAGCAYSGQVLSYTKIMGQLQDAGNTTTLAHYLALLDQAGLLAGLSKFSPDVVRQRASSPKFQVHNNALMSAFEPTSFQDVRRRPERWGRWVESAVGAHLLNQCLAHRLELYYWRDRGSEIDFVIAGQGRVVGLEVKSTASGRTSGMQAFSDHYRPDRVFLIGEAGLDVDSFLQVRLSEIIGDMT